MELTKHRISLDIHRQTTQAHLAVKKGDTARQIVASLVNGGVPYNIADGCYAVFMAKKPDGNILYNDCAIEGNRIVYTFTEQTASAAGLMACELRLYGSDNKVITSPRIAIIVNGAVYDDPEVESADEFSALAKLVEEVREAKEKFPQKLTINGQSYDGSNGMELALPNISIPKKILSLGDSIAYGARNGFKGFVGDLGVPYRICAKSGATLATVKDNNVLAQLETVTDYEPDIVIAEGGINDYVRGVAMGAVPTAAVATEAEAVELNTRTVMGALQYLLYRMGKKYPDAEHYFLLIHKVTQNGKDYTVTKNEPEDGSVGYTQTELFENIKDVCALYGVGIVDIFGESCINTAYPEFVAPVDYSTDPSVTYSYWVNSDGLHPLDYGYRHGYVPIVRKTLKLGGDNAVDTQALYDTARAYLADEFHKVDDSEKYGRKTARLTEAGSYFIYEPSWEDVPINKNGAATMLAIPYHNGRTLQILVPSWDKTDRPLPVLTRLVNRSDGSVRRDWMASDGTRPVKILCVGDDIASGYRNDFKGFVGDLGAPWQKVAQAYATLSNAAVAHNSRSIAELLEESVAAYAPGIVIACGGINDYLYDVALGTVPDAAVASDEAANGLDRSTVMGGLQYLLYRMKNKYPDAEHHFLLMHKVTMNGKDLTATANAAGYTQTELFDAIKTVCGLYSVGIVDVFGESCINTAYPEFVSPVSWSDDSSVTHTQWVDADGFRPLAYGYLHGYMPIVRKALKLGGDNAVDNQAVFDMVRAFVASRPLTINGQKYDGSAEMEVDTTSFVAQISGSDASGYTCNKTLDEIDAADKEKREIYCVANNRRMFCTSKYGSKVAGVWGYTFSGVDSGTEYRVSIGTNGISFTSTKLVPDALPNPKPMAINGQSYDGSEAMSLDLIEKKNYSLIQRIELTEESNSLLLSNLDLRALRAFFVVPKAAATTSVGAELYMGSTLAGTAWLANLISDAAERVAMVEGWQDGGLVGFAGVAPANTTQQAQTYSRIPRCTAASGAFTKLRMYGSGGKVFPAGTVVELWGY